MGLNKLCVRTEYNIIQMSDAASHDGTDPSGLISNESTA